MKIGKSVCGVALSLRSRAGYVLYCVRLKIHAILYHHFLSPDPIFCDLEGEIAEQGRADYLRIVGGLGGGLGGGSDGGSGGGLLRWFNKHVYGSIL